MIFSHTPIPSWVVFMEATVLSVLVARCMYVISDFIIYILEGDDHGYPPSS